MDCADKSMELCRKVGSGGKTAGDEERRRFDRLEADLR